MSEIPRIPPPDPLEEELVKAFKAEVRRAKAAHHYGEVECRIIVDEHGRVTRASYIAPARYCPQEKKAA